MDILNTHNKEIKKKFDETYPHLNDSTPEGGYDAKPYVLTFITNQNKQLYIKIAEGEIEYWKNIFDNPPKRNKEYPCDNCTKNICRLEIDKWNNILQELNK